MITKVVLATKKRRPNIRTRRKIAHRGTTRIFGSKPTL